MYRTGRHLPASHVLLLACAILFASRASARDPGIERFPGAPTRGVSRFEEVLALFQMPPAQVFVVTDPGDAQDDDVDDGIFQPQTLRSAIQNANRTPALDEVRFAAAAASINPEIRLPAFQAPVIVDGAIDEDTQVVIDGSGVTVNANGLEILFTGAWIRNLEIRNFTLAGIALITSSTPSLVQGCRLHGNIWGVNASNASGNVIGGVTPDEWNWMYDNRGGVALIGSSHSNTVLGNIIGWEDATTPSPQVTQGVLVRTWDNIVASNVISGNLRGIEADEMAARNLYEHNYIGTTIDGSAAGANDVGIYFSEARDDTVRQNVVSGNTGYGIDNASSSGVLILGNNVGLDSSGLRPLANVDDGIWTRSRCVIADNFVGANRRGIVVNETSTLVTNRVGHHDAALEPVGNRFQGIWIANADSVIVGGSAENANVVSGNGRAGITLAGAGVHLNEVSWNLVGTTEAGTEAAPNGVGIEIGGGASENTLYANLVSGNTGHGVRIYAEGSQAPSENTISENLIGVDDTFDVNPLGNGGSGVFIEAGDDNHIEDGNVIAYNQGDGVTVLSGTGNTIRENTIGENDGLAIDLGDDGPTPNDFFDDDEGPNRLLNHPALTYVVHRDGATHVRGHIVGPVDTTLTLDFYAVETPDPSGHGEAETHLESILSWEGESAYQTFFSAVILELEDRVVATATDEDGNTSELSRSPIMVNSTGDAGDADSEDCACDTGGSPVDGRPECTLRAAIEQANACDGRDWIAFDLPQSESWTITPAQALPAVQDTVVIDGRTQEGFVADDVVVTIDGTQAGDAHGLVSVVPWVEIDGLEIRRFAGDGIHSDGMVVGSDLCLTDNGGSGVAAGEVHIHGLSRVQRNGQDGSGDRSRGGAPAGIDGEMRVEITGALIVDENAGEGVLSSNGPIEVLGEAEADGILVAHNGGDGLRAGTTIRIESGDVGISNNDGSGLENQTGDITIDVGYLDVSLNGERGIDAFRDARVTVQDSAVIAENGEFGVWSGGYVVFNGGPVSVRHNAPDLSADECENLALAGVFARNGLFAEALEITSNCTGVRITEGFVRIGNDVRVENNRHIGLWATGDVIIDGQSHVISGNGAQGVFTSAGRIEITGSADVTFNGGEYDADACAEEMSAALSAGYGVSTGEIYVDANCGGGVYANAGDVVIQGDAVVAENAMSGIYARFGGVRLEGARHEILENGAHGIWAARDVAARGVTVLERNGRNTWTQSPETCGDSDVAGIVARNITAETLTTRDTCGSGLRVLERVEVSGTVDASANARDGIEAASVVLAAGNVCNNGRYGILLHGGQLTAENVKVCENGVGGIEGGVTARVVGRAPSGGGQGVGRVVNSALVGNAGDGLSWGHTAAVDVTSSILSDNEGFALRRLGNGAPVSADGNWWGDPTGPGGAYGGSGDEASEGVDVSSWLDAAPRLVVSISGDSLFVAAGLTDSLDVFVRDWTEQVGDVSMSVTDDGGWVQGPAVHDVPVGDSLPSRVRVPIMAPAARGDDLVTLVRASAAEPGSGVTREDSLWVAAYLPAVARITLSPDSVLIAPLDSLRFVARGWDQHDRALAFEPSWSATGGTVDSNGTFVAGETLGGFEVTCTDPDTGVSASAVVVIDTVTPVPIDDQQDPATTPPAARILTLGASPNPFNPRTRLSLSVPIPGGRVAVEIFDASGRRVRTLLTGELEPGTHTLVWDGRDDRSLPAASGVYFARATHRAEALVRQLVLLK